MLQNFIFSIKLEKSRSVSEVTFQTILPPKSVIKIRVKKMKQLLRIYIINVPFGTQ